MRTNLIRAAAILALVGIPAYPHRLDEYLQATIFSVEKDRIEGTMILTPGVAVFPVLFSNIDANTDGIISQTEEYAYAERVLHDLSLSIDGHRLTLQLVSIRFATRDEMQEGLGQILLEFYTALPPGGRTRKFIFENHHQSQIAAYQVNCLVPRDPNIRIATQNRNYSQSLYELKYEQAGVYSVPSLSVLWSGHAGWWCVFALLVLTSITRWRARLSA